MQKPKLEKYVRAADLGDNAASTFVNYGVKKKAEGKYGLSRKLMVAAYILFAVAYAGTLIGLHILPIIAFTPVLTWMLVFFTWRYVSIEYEYYILDGEFKMLEVYGSKSMRELCRVRISAMQAIAPYRDEYKAAADAVAAENRIESVSTMSSPDIYYAIFESKDGMDCVVFFEATEKTLKVIKYYNSDVKIVKTTH